MRRPVSRAHSALRVGRSKGHRCSRDFHRHRHDVCRLHMGDSVMCLDCGLRWPFGAMAADAWVRYGRGALALCTQVPFQFTRQWLCERTTLGWLLVRLRAMFWFAPSPAYHPMRTDAVSCAVCHPSEGRFRCTLFSLSLSRVRGTQTVWAGRGRGSRRPRALDLLFDAGGSARRVYHGLRLGSRNPSTANLT